MSKIKECWACKSEVKCEKHHYPVSRLYGGTSTIPLCYSCHNFVSRTPMINWPDHMYMDALRAMDDLPLAAKLAALKFIEKGFHFQICAPKDDDSEDF